MGDKLDLDAIRVWGKAALGDGRPSAIAATSADYARMMSAYDVRLPTHSVRSQMLALCDELEATRQERDDARSRAEYVETAHDNANADAIRLADELDAERARNVLLRDALEAMCDREEACQKLLATYRTGTLRPAEKAMDVLHKTRDIPAAARSSL